MVDEPKEVRLSDYRVTVEMVVRVRAASASQVRILAERFQPALFIETPGFNMETENGGKVKKIDLIEKYIPPPVE